MATPHQIRLTGPRGRLVQGDAFEPKTKDQNGAPLTVKTGPNAGQPTQRWFIGVAYPKNHPETLPYLMQLAAVGKAAWPAYMAGFNNTPPNFGCSHPRFSWKIIDGDGLDDSGKPNAEKPGFAGHWVVKYSTSIKAPGVWQEPNFAEMEQITDPRMLPRGYFVRVHHTVDTNENDQRPGIFVNLDKIAICADQAGAEIIQSGPSAAEAFGGGGGGYSALTAPAPGGARTGALIMKNGMDYAAMKAAGWTDDQMVTAGHAERAVASAPLSVSPPPAPPVPTPAASTPPPPSAGAPATPSPSSPPPPPYGGFIPQTPPAGPVMTAAANGATYEQMIAAGWTDAMLKQHGMMA